jgi:predicted DNA-binding transcriptional regulator AlpA
MTMVKHRKTPKLDGFWTKEEASEKIGTCVRTLDRMHLARTGPPRIKLGGRILYREAAVVAWLISKEVSYGGSHGRRR